MDEKLAENNKRVPAELAELVFEVQEQLGELRQAHNGSANCARRRDESAARGA